MWLKNRSNQQRTKALRTSPSPWFWILRVTCLLQHKRFKMSQRSCSLDPQMNGAGTVPQFRGQTL